MGREPFCWILVADAGERKDGKKKGGMKEGLGLQRGQGRVRGGWIYCSCQL
jgi:hypothetical protein